MYPGAYAARQPRMFPARSRGSYDSQASHGRRAYRSGSGSGNSYGYGNGYGNGNGYGQGSNGSGCLVSMRLSAYAIIVFCVLALIGAIVWMVVLAAVVDWDNVFLTHLTLDFHNALVGSTAFWKWIYASPVIVAVVAIFGIVAAAVLLNQYLDKQKNRLCFALFLMIGVLLCVLAAGIMGAWTLNSHSGYVTYGDLLDSVNCKDDFPTACGNKEDTNANWAWFRFRQAHLALLGVGIVTLILILLALTVACIVFMCPVHDWPVPRMVNAGPHAYRRQFSGGRPYYKTHPYY